MAGAAKLSDLRGFEQTLGGLGVPIRPIYRREMIAVLVPIAELGIGFGLVLQLLILASSLAAFLLLLCFTVVLALSRRRQNDTPCRCFGALTGTVSTRWEMIRGGGLALASGLCAAGAWSGLMPSIPFQAMLTAVPLSVGFVVLGFVTAQAARTMEALDSLGAG